MTLPNQYLPNSIYFITRRTVQGQFFCKPTPETVLIFKYASAFCAKRHKIELHGFVIMSNHIHMIISDKYGTIPFFLRDFFSLTAKSLNKKLKKTQSIWSSSRPGITRLITPQDVINKMVYILANPVKAHIVKKHSRWPGLISTIQKFTKKSSLVKKPIRLFNKNSSKLPPNVKLQFKIPNVFLDKQRYIEEITSNLEIRESEIIKNHKGKKFLGVKKALSIDCFSSPEGPLKKSRINPTIACCDKELRFHEIEKLIIFRRKYRDTYKKWKNGEKTIRFPKGTFAMFYYHGVNINEIEEDFPYESFG
jgi:REP-associated tyrosine transposase